MREAKAIIIGLEVINLLIGIAANAAALNDAEFLGLPTEWWNIICFSAFIVGFLVLYFLFQSTENAIKRDVYAHVRADIDEKLKELKPQEGSLDNVTQQDRKLIIAFAMDMILKHGHMDIPGLLADRASGVPLNELMAGKCQQCGTPRNQKSKE